MVKVLISTDKSAVHLADSFSNAYGGTVVQEPVESSDNIVDTVVDIDPSEIGKALDPNNVITIRDSSDVERIARGFATVAISNIERKADKPGYEDGRQYLIGEDRPAIRLKDEQGILTLARTLPTSEGGADYKIDLIGIPSND